MPACRVWRTRPVARPRSCPCRGRARPAACALLFQALALALCQRLPVRQSAKMLSVKDTQLWRRIEHCVTETRRKQDMSQVRIVGIDETSLRRGQDYVGSLAPVP